MAGSTLQAAPQATLLQEYLDPVQQNAAEFGFSVAGYGNQPLVGSPGTNAGGAAYLYDAGLSATPVKTLLPPGSFIANDFGRAVASSNFQILIADPAAGPLSGSGGVTTGPLDATPYNFRGVVVHYLNSLDTSPRVLVNPLVGPVTGFGNALAFGHGGQFAVGDPFLTTASLSQSGRAYLYNSQNTSPTAIIENPVPASQARYGKSLAFYSDGPAVAFPPDTETSYQGALVVGAPGLDAVFQYNPETGDLLSIIESPNTSHESFGFSMTTVDQRLIVGAPEAGNLAGRVYIFDRFSGTLLRTIFNPNSATERFFGYSLAMIGSTQLAVGIEPRGTGPAKVRVFNINTGAAVAELTSPHTLRTKYGTAVAAVGGNVLVGDPAGAKDAPSGVPGRAYLFSLAGDSTVAPDAPLNLTASPVNSTSIFLTYQDNSLNETGFTLERRTGAVGAFSPVATLPANSSSYTDNNLTPATEYWYRLQAFNLAGASPYSNETSATTPSTPPPDLVGQIPNPGGIGDLFGFSISKVGKARFAVGAPGVDANAVANAGRVYVFTPPSLAPTLVLNNPNPLPNDQFGYSVGAVGENILVGAPGNQNTVNGGTAYLFSGIDGQVLFTYHHPAASAGRQFGYSVAGYGKKRALIGAPGGGPLSLPGSAHLFDAKKTAALLRSFDSATSSPGDRFGDSVAAAKGRAAIVSKDPPGQPCTNTSIEVFTLKTGALVGTRGDAGVVTEAKGKFLVGAPFIGCATGDPYSYLLSGTTLKLLYLNPTSQPDGFGLGVGGGKKFNAIGAALFDSNSALDAGRAYLFKSKLQAPLRTYENPSPNAGDQFGYALALPGKLFLVIGSPYDDGSGLDAGAVYLYSVPRR
ncbi:MAG: fibronectin type III domain-containing protein [Candidatus Sumerlaeaceae bacterium]